MAIIFSLGTIAAANAMHTALIHNVMRLPLVFFDTTPLGRILNRFSKDVDTCDNVLPHVTRMLIAMNFTVSLINFEYSLLQFSHGQCRHSWGDNFWMKIISLECFGTARALQV